MPQIDGVAESDTALDCIEARTYVCSPDRTRQYLCVDELQQLYTGEELGGL